MNRIHLPPYRQPPIELADEASFAGAGAPPPEFGIANPGAIVAHLTARHCAGLSYRPDAQSVLNYLLDKTEGTPETEWAIRSLLNGCSVPDAMHLIVLCQVPVDCIARCVRSLHVTNFVLIRFLNQFAVPRADDRRQTGVGAGS